MTGIVNNHNRNALIAYHATLLIFLAGSFFPQARLWGVSWWAWFPIWARLGVFALGLAVPWLIAGLYGRKSLGVVDFSQRTYTVLTGLTVTACVAAYYLARVRTHFLGNGYTLLANLASQSPTTKSHEVGEELIHQWVKAFIGGGNTEATALLAYQIVSIAIGVLFLLAAVYFARRLFESRLERLLFLLVLVSGGYMLLFFGYVENRALLCLFVAIFTLTGTLVSQGKANRWLLLPPLALASVAHIFGVALIPAAVYLVAADTRFGRKIAALSIRAKLSVAAAGVVLAIAAFLYAYFTDYFFRFASMSLVTDRFTEAGYTLFSLNHLLDYANLLFVLSPGLLITVTLLFAKRGHPLWRGRSTRFLVILVVSSLAESFIFDPRLGMPRDWDMFAFSGIPLAVLAFYAASSGTKDGRSNLIVKILIPVLGLMLLVPRVVTQASPQRSVDLLRTYYTLDKERNSAVRYVLVKYLQQNGDLVQSERERSLFKADYPQVDLLFQCEALLRSQKYREAAQCYQQAMTADVRRSQVWANLGASYNGLGLYDSAVAVLRVADGLRPKNVTIYVTIAYSYFKLKDYKKSEQYGLDAWSMAPDSLACQTTLIGLYGATRQNDKLAKFLNLVLGRDDVPVPYFMTLGDRLMNAGQREFALNVYRRAIAKGLDSVAVRQLVLKYPELASVPKKN
jgi:tetratricopeptide (TPR) repeat protein